MLFIGIIAESKDFKLIKRKVLQKINEQENKLENKLEIININNKSIENLQNVKFETIIILSSLEKFKTKEKQIKNILSNCKYLIINADIEMDRKLIEDLKFDIITFGLNQKSTITASSINEDNIIICLQRNIKNVKENIIEINEFNIKYNKKENETVYNILAYFAILLLYDVI